VGGVSWAIGELVGWSSTGAAVLAVVAGAVVGGVVYLGMLTLLRVEELSALTALVPARLRPRGMKRATIIPSCNMHTAREWA